MLSPSPNLNKPRLHTLKLDPLILLNHLHTILYSCTLLACFYHHLMISPTNSASSSLLILANAIFAFMWVLTRPFRWRPVSRRELPHELLRTVKQRDLPALDVFICTADPWKEPPMTVVNTVLSVMAYDYPPEKISVFVSDDGGSDLTLFALMEAAKFARYWLPFCKENEVVERAPEDYFDSDKDVKAKNLKLMYQKMKEKVKSAMEKGYVDSDLVKDVEEYNVFKRFKGFTCRDHPSVIQVLGECSKVSDITGYAIPNLIYVSREKRPTSAHHFKAGAQNALLRVSSVMTNAPVILTLDCDMYSNDSQTLQRALCYILDPAIAPKLSFVQFPQHFQGLNKNDIYGGEIKRLFVINARAMDGIQGTGFVGTGCFFMRHSLYGPPSSSVSQLSSDLEYSMGDDSLHFEYSDLKRAHEVAGCDYEIGTEWGVKIGFRYGSLVEDYFTCFLMHKEGWESVFCNPERPAFLGQAPKTLHDTLSQCKRWTMGLLEVGFSKYNPLLFGARKAPLLMNMCYAHYSFWGCWSIPVTIYALLPQLALIYNHPLFPRVSDPWFYLYAFLFLASYCQELIEFLMADGTIQRWWSDQRIWMMKCLTSYSFAIIETAMNQTGLSVPEFSVTTKLMEDGQSERYNNGVFDFGIESPFFIILGTVTVINFFSFFVGIMNATRSEGGYDKLFVQLFISSFAVANCWPIMEAMLVRKDGGKMPRKATLCSVLLAGIICILGYFALAE